MEKYFLFFALLFVSCHSGAQGGIYPEQFPQVKGFKTIVVKAKDQCTKGLGQETILYSLKIDTSGKIAERVYKNSDNQIITDTPHKAGRKDIRKTEYYPDGKVKTELYHQVYEYIENGKTVLGFSTSDIKAYEYRDSVIIVKYFRNNALLSVERFILNTQGKISRRTLRAVTGTVIKEVSYHYDNKLRLKEMIGNESGKDGFGNTTDGWAYERSVFHYDQAGKLARKEEIYKNKICNIERYEYLQ